LPIESDAHGLPDAKFAKIRIARPAAAKIEYREGSFLSFKFLFLIIASPVLFVGDFVNQSSRSRKRSWRI